jgi:hypothetical protein
MTMRVKTVKVHVESPRTGVWHNHSANILVLQADVGLHGSSEGFYAAGVMHV